TGGTLEKYLSAEMAAWAMCFGLGKVVKSGSASNWTYTCTPLIPANGDATELPYFSFVEQIRPGAGSVIDRLLPGCAVEGWTITVGSGPGRANSKITVEFHGSGKLTEPSAITMPAATVEKLLPSASLTLTINGVDRLRHEQEHRLPRDVVEEQHPHGCGLLSWLRLPDVRRCDHRRDPRQTGVR
ncbi:MAG: hypothetical protein LAQ69_45690, partial [Acidobacteriia bacterium]|nr:hypothetical protein [Terriglobia bacterium]